MDLTLTKKPKSPIIIEGFPGFGLVATIATEFLIQHLKCELIGKYWFEESTATIAIHEGKIINPIGIYYNKEYNIVIVHAISGTAALEWEAADLLAKLAHQVKASQIISIEGVGSPTETAEPQAFYYTNSKKSEEILKKCGFQPLSEGIIIGVTAALMLKTAMPLTAFFADTKSNLPDSKAAAKVITMLDKYLGLKVDPLPLIKTAEIFEQKLKKILEQSMDVQQEAKKKQLSYVG